MAGTLLVDEPEPLEEPLLLLLSVLSVARGCLIAGLSVRLTRVACPWALEDSGWP